MVANRDQIDQAIADRIRADAARGESITIGCILATTPPYVPSRESVCVVCERAVWVSRRIDAVLPPDARIICLSCVTIEQ